MRTKDNFGKMRRSLTHAQKKKFESFEVFDEEDAMDAGNYLRETSALNLNKKKHVRKTTRKIKHLGYFGKKMPDSTTICEYCSHYQTRNLPGGWRESGCVKHGWKSDGMGGSGKRIGQSYDECKGKDFDYIQRRRRGEFVPKPEWVD